MSRARDFADLAGSADAGGLTGRNLIINGACVIDQRNGGASVNASDTVFGVDRFNMFSQTALATKGDFQQNAGSVTPPTGFTNYLGFTSTSAYTIASGEGLAIQQRIEGYNLAQLGWGSSDAKSATVSFWVRSSLTGTFGCSIRNSAGNRSYPFTYTISSANTWEYKSVTIPGETTGTWLTTNGIGAYLLIGLGVGSTYSGTAGSWASANYIGATGATSVVATNGATFYITGVQLEVGEQATPFEHRSYDDELARCQRYYCKTYDDGVTPGTVTSNGIVMHSLDATQSYAKAVWDFPVTMRTTPTVVLYSPNNGTSGQVAGDASNYSGSTGYIGTNRVMGGVSGVSLSQSVYLKFHGTADAEL